MKKLVKYTIPARIAAWPIKEAAKVSRLRTKETSSAARLENRLGPGGAAVMARSCLVKVCRRAVRRREPEKGFLGEQASGSSSERCHSSASRSVVNEFDPTTDPSPCITGRSTRRIGPRAGKSRDAHLYSVSPL